MCDFEDDFGDDGFEEDSFEDHFEDQIDDPDDMGNDSAVDSPEPDEFTARDAFFVGSIIGNAYEEAMDEKKQRKLWKLEKDRKQGKHRQ